MIHLIRPKLQFNTIAAARAFYAARRTSPGRSFAACIRACGHMQDIQIVGIAQYDTGSDCRFMGLQA